MKASQTTTAAHEVRQSHLQKVSFLYAGTYLAFYDKYVLVTRQDNR